MKSKDVNLFKTAFLMVGFVGTGGCGLYYKRKDIGEWWFNDYKLGCMKRQLAIQRDKPTSFDIIRTGSDLSQSAMNDITWAKMLLVEYNPLQDNLMVNLDEFEHYMKKLNANSHAVEVARSHPKIIEVSSNTPQDYDPIMSRYFEGACMAMSTDFIKEILNGMTVEEALAKFKMGYPNHLEEVNRDMRGVFGWELYGRGKFLVHNEKLRSFGVEITKLYEYLNHKDTHSVTVALQSLPSGAYYCVSRNSSISESGHAVALIVAQDDQGSRSFILFDPNFGAVFFDPLDVTGGSLYNILAKQLRFHQCSGIAISKVQKIQPENKKMKEVKM
jgi:hypothetical protein